MGPTDAFVTRHLIAMIAKKRKGLHCDEGVDANARQERGSLNVDSRAVQEVFSDFVPRVRLKTPLW